MRSTAPRTTSVPLLALVAVLFAVMALAGCLGGFGPDAGSTGVGDPIDGGDGGPGADDGWETFELPDEVTGLRTVAEVSHGSAGGLWIRDGFAYVSGLNSGFLVVDVRDPANATVVGTLAETSDGEAISSRDVDLIDVPAAAGDGADGTDANTTDGADDADGATRTIAALAEGGPTMYFVDVTDPADPVHVSTLDVGQSVHNLAVVPNTTLVYNSRSLGDAVEPGIDIVDASDPADPEVVARWTFPPAAAGQPVRTTGCHDITVYADPARAYCAGVTQTYVMDVADPMEPEIVGVITNPLINIHHTAIPTDDHDLLLVGDEYGGTLLPACHGYEDTGTEAGAVSTPTGALWFYDISEPTAPVLQGYVSAPTPSEGNAATCTAHFGDFVGDRPLFAMGWYTAGVLLVDFSDPTRPFILDQAVEDKNPWDVRYWNGHLVTGDIGSGASVLRVV